MDEKLPEPGTNRSGFRRIQQTQLTVTVPKGKGHKGHKHSQRETIVPQQGQLSESIRSITVLQTQNADLEQNICNMETSNVAFLEQAAVLKGEIEVRSLLQSQLIATPPQVTNSSDYHDDGESYSTGSFVTLKPITSKPTESFSTQTLRAVETVENAPSPAETANSSSAESLTASLANLELGEFCAAWLEDEYKAALDVGTAGDDCLSERTYHQRRRTTGSNPM